ncbi:MAG: putative enoyl-CoA hydratase echA8 [Deltaproteobacteria bacterium ADurb.Bin510]|nr:MAG: putative enoyl-CoA hydratase echA8 [Deltaproteobacteria bacterium ADurb.Bin510]
MDYQFLKFEVIEGVAVVEMDRKKELNALSQEMMGELYHVFGRLIPKRDDIRVVILTGGEQLFSAGMDLRQAIDSTSADITAYCEKAVGVFNKILELDRILITAVSGICMGGGFNLAMMGDIIIASENAIFSHPEIKYGFNPVLTPLFYRVGLTRTKELALRGDPIGAREAYDMGLVNRVVAPEAFREEAWSWAKQLRKRPPETVRILKRAFDVVPHLNAKAAITYELELSALLVNSSPELKESMRKILKPHG